TSTELKDSFIDLSLVIIFPFPLIPIPKFPSKLQDIMTMARIMEANTFVSVFIIVRFLMVPLKFLNSRRWMISYSKINYYFLFRNKIRSEEHTSELQSRENLVCRLLLEKKNEKTK